MSEQKEGSAMGDMRKSEDQIHSYPTDNLAAVIDARDETVAAVEALTADGFAAPDIHVFAGAEAAAALEASAGRTGLAGLAIRIAERLGIENDEMMVKQRFEQALRDGHYLVFVDAADEERKERASAILHAHGAHHVGFLGRFTMEKMFPPAAG